MRVFAHRRSGGWDRPSAGVSLGVLRTAHRLLIVGERFTESPQLFLLRAETAFELRDFALQPAVALGQLVCLHEKCGTLIGGGAVADDLGLCLRETFFNLMQLMPPPGDLAIYAADGGLQLVQVVPLPVAVQKRAFERRRTYALVDCAARPNGEPVRIAAIGLEPEVVACPVGGQIGTNVVLAAGLAVVGHPGHGGSPDTVVEAGRAPVTKLTFALAHGSTSCEPRTKH